MTPLEIREKVLKEFGWKEGYEEDISHIGSTVQEAHNAGLENAIDLSVKLAAAEMKKEFVEHLDSLIKKVWFDIADEEKTLEDWKKNADKRGLVHTVKIRNSKIFGMKSVLIDIEDWKKKWGVVR